MAKFLAVLESCDTGQMTMIAVFILELVSDFVLQLAAKHRSGKSDLDYTSAASVIFGAKGCVIEEQQWTVPSSDYRALFSLD